MALSCDPAGNRIQAANAVGTPSQNSVSYTHDRLGRMLTQNDPEHGIYTSTYDALGQKLRGNTSILTLPPGGES